MKQVIGVIFLLFSLISTAQTNTFAYSRNYEFKEGLFLTFEQFKKNTPIPKFAIVSLLPKDQIDFLTQVTEQKIITYKDTAGAEQKIEANTIWGFYQNRTVFINFNNGFNRLNVIGTLSLFSSIVAQTPLRNEPIGDMYAIEPTFEELRQFVYDTQTNKVFDFNVKNMEILLKNDAELYGQFMKLKKRKKADSIFIYLRKYNEKHPLYLSNNMNK